MDQLFAMRAFVEAVKRRSLGNAAEALGSSRTLVSRQLQMLEDRLGTRLLIRTTRSLSLTPAGERYFHFCDEMIAQIEGMDRAISAEAHEARGELPILAPDWMYEAMTGAITAFVARHPEVEPKLVFGDMAQTAYDFLDQGCELALHARHIPDSRIVARKLSTLAYAICASPGYLAGVTPIGKPGDVSTHAGIMQYNSPVWTVTRNGRKDQVHPRPVFSSNTYLASRTAILKDLGLACLPLHLVREDLAQGRLVLVLPDYEPLSQSLYLSVAPGSGMPARVRLMMDFLPTWFKANPL
ncbi:MAG TPA: LysR family transcriptional regulator [Paenirhodobacter sp.]